MNNEEIKEKIQYLIDNVEYEPQPLIDYITNLQEIAEEHKNCSRKHWQQKCAEHCANEMIYKSRIEKANKLLNKIYNVLPGGYNQLLIEIRKYLQGDDKSE